VWLSCLSYLAVCAVRGGHHIISYHILYHRKSSDMYDVWSASESQTSFDVCVKWSYGSVKRAYQIRPCVVKSTNTTEYSYGVRSRKRRGRLLCKVGMPWTLGLSGNLDFFLKRPSMIPGLIIVAAYRGSRQHGRDAVCTPYRVDIPRFD
jgi:hypothetical protein